MKKFGLILLFFLFFTQVNSVDAHSGRTDAYGGHNCYVGACAGTYHCHSCGYTPPPPPVYTPPKPKTPAVMASFNYSPNADGTFDIFMDWDEVSNTGFSITLNDIAGADPGPSIDTHLSEYRFTNVYPGTYYANMKVGVNGIWSDVTYWKIEVPEWHPPQPTASPKSNNSNSYDDTWDGDLALLILLGVGGYLVYKGLKK